MSRGNISSRLEKLEASARSGPSGRCPECGLPPHGPGHIVLFGEAAPRQTLPDDLGERCSRCDRPLWCVVRLVYDEEGEGARADA
jgi:hypothetical protein